MRLNVYLSSTYEDLARYRDKVASALRTVGHHVIGMEEYAAGDIRPLDKCLADVRTADIYVGIFAWRYGYVPKAKVNPRRRSITELEFREATRVAKSRLIFLLSEDAAWPSRLMDAHTGDGERGERIRKLRDELRTGLLVSKFDGEDELAAKVVTAVARWQLDSQQIVTPEPSPAPRQAREDPSAMRGHGKLWRSGARLRVLPRRYPIAASTHRPDRPNLVGLCERLL